MKQAPSPVRPRVAVYAIALNERAFCDRFYASCSGADLVFVLDTGSTDGTAERLRSLGAQVEELCIKPWRFDVARNAALAALPDDIDLCIALDLDEVLAPGWREALDRAWEPGVTRVRYSYTWSWRLDGSPDLEFLANKIHHRRGYRWIHPCHEILDYTDQSGEITSDAPELQIHHHPDPTKPRAQYLGLLELGTREYPDSARQAYYYGRELSFHGRWREAIDELGRYLTLADATWPEERSQAMILLSRGCQQIGDGDGRLRWAIRATAEVPERREVWCELAQAGYERANWPQCYAAAVQALAITEQERNSLDDGDCWGAKPWDQAAMAAYNLGLYQRAAEYGRRALDLAPQDPRLAANLLHYYAPSARPPRSWPKRSIAYYASAGGPFIEQWSPRSLERGIAGDRTAVIELTRRFAADGYDVTVFGDPREDEGVYDGVRYLPWCEINWDDTFDVLILWRTTHFLDRPLKARKVLVDLHDMALAAEWTPARLARADALFFKSLAHRASIPQLQEEKAVVISNGVGALPASLSPSTSAAVPRQHRLLYCSDYVRGLDVLLELWPRVRDRVPDAMLDVCFGWQIFDAWTDAQPWRPAWKERVENLLLQEGVVHHGRVGKAELAAVRAACGIWAYPSTVSFETNCMAGLESQAAGLVPVIVASGALGETVQSGVTVSGDAHDAETQERYLAGLLHAMTDESFWRRESARASAYATRFTWQAIAAEWEQHFD